MRSRRGGAEAPTRPVSYWRPGSLPIQVLKGSLTAPAGGVRPDRKRFAEPTRQRQRDYSGSGRYYSGSGVPVLLWERGAGSGVPGAGGITLGAGCRWERGAAGSGVPSGVPVPVPPEDCSGSGVSQAVA